MKLSRRLVVLPPLLASFGVAATAGATPPAPAAVSPAAVSPAVRPAVPTAAVRAVARPVAPVLARQLARETYAQRGQRLYGSLHYDVRALGYRIVFRHTTTSLLGLTDSRTRTVTIYVHDRESDLVLKHSIAHEIGHALDFTHGTDARHQLYLKLRYLRTPLRSWYGCNTCTDYSTPAGDWAEVFAQWLAGPGDFRSRLAGVPSKAKLVQLTPLFSLRLALRAQT